MQLLEQLANNDQSFNEMLIESIVNNPITEGIVKKKPIPEKFQSESKKIFDKYLTLIKGTDDYDKQKEKFNKLLGTKRLYSFSSNKVEKPESMFKLMKSLGYKECVDKNQKNGELRYYLKEIGDYYMTIIVATAPGKDKESGKNELALIVNYADASKVTDKTLALYK